LRTIRLGDLLVKHGALTSGQRDQIVQAQRSSRAKGGKAGRPFGVLAEEMFGVSPRAVEQAWAEQFAAYSASVDARRLTPDAETLSLVSTRQAWQFRLIPVRLDSDEVVLCTSQHNLVRAMKFAGWKLGQGFEFLLTDAKALGEAMMRHYPMPGMSAEMIECAAAT
jgi:hypothetical protein